MKTITIGKENATFQELVALKENRTKRASTGKFFVEGTQNIKDATSSGFEIAAFIFSKNAKLSDWAKSVLPLAETCYALDSSLFAQLSSKSEPGELLTIVKMKKTKATPSKNPLVVLVDRPSKKGNLGTIIRSCDALGVNEILLLGHGIDVYDPQVIAASMGSLFKVHIRALASNEEFLEYVGAMKSKYAGFQVVGSSLKATTLLSEVDFKKPTLLVVGNEATGMSKFLTENVDILAKINMRQGVNSLNVSCATSIFLYEVSRQRG